MTHIVLRLVNQQTHHQVRINIQIDTGKDSKRCFENTYLYGVKRRLTQVILNIDGYSEGLRRIKTLN